MATLRDELLAMKAKRQSRRDQGSVLGAIGEDFSAGIKSIGQALDPTTDQGLLSRVLGGVGGAFEVAQSYAAPLTHAVENFLPAIPPEGLEGNINLSGINPLGENYVTAGKRAATNPISGPNRQLSGDPGIDMAVKMISGMLPTEMLGAFAFRLANKGRGAALRFLRTTLDLPSAEAAQKTLAQANNDMKVAELLPLADDAVDVSPDPRMLDVLPAEGLADEVSYATTAERQVADKAKQANLKAELLKTRADRWQVAKEKYDQQQILELNAEQDKRAAEVFAERAANLDKPQLALPPPSGELQLPGGTGAMLTERRGWRSSQMPEPTTPLGPAKQATIVGQPAAAATDDIAAQGDIFTNDLLARLQKAEVEGKLQGKGNALDQLVNAVKKHLDAHPEDYWKDRTGWEKDVNVAAEATGLRTYERLAKSEDTAVAAAKAKPAPTPQARQRVQAKRQAELATTQPYQGVSDEMFLGGRKEADWIASWKKKAGQRDASASVKAKPDRAEFRTPKEPLPPEQVAQLEQKLPTELKPQDYMLLRRQIQSLHGPDATLKEWSAKILGEGRSGPRTHDELQQMKDALLDFAAKAGRDPGTIAALPEAQLVVNPAAMAVEPLSNMKHAWNGISSGFLESGRAFLSRQGAAGKMLAGLIDSKEGIWRRRAGGAIDELLTHTKGFTAAQKNEFRRALDYGEPVTDPKVATILDLTRTRTASMYDEFSAMGGEVYTTTGKKVPASGVGQTHYFPHFIDMDKVRPKGVIAPRLIDQISKRYNIPLHEAELLIKQYIGRHSVRRFGNMEHARELDLPDEYYHTDPINALTLYYARGYDRLEEMAHFGRTPILDPRTGKVAGYEEVGPNRERVLQLIQQIRAEGGDDVFAQKIVDQVMGTTEHNRALEWASRQLVSWQVLTKMSPMSTILNLSQPLLVALRTDLKTFGRTVKAITKERAEGTTLALQSGGTLERYIADAARLMGAPIPGLPNTMGELTGALNDSRLGDLASWYLKRIGFGAAEDFNRSFSALAGREYITELTTRMRSGGEKAMRRARYDLTRLGYGEDDIQRLVTNGPAKDDILRVAQQITDDTQFYHKPQNLPRMFGTPGGRILLQFKSFMHQTSRLIVNEWHHAWKKDPASFAKKMGVHLLFIPAVAEMYNSARSEGRAYGAAVANYLARGVGLEEAKLDIPRISGRKMTMLERYWRDLSSVAAFGILGDAVEAFRYGDYGLTNLLAGPTGQQMVDTIELAGSPTEARARRLAQKNIPMISPFLTGPKRKKTTKPYPYN